MPTPLTQLESALFEDMRAMGDFPTEGSFFYWAYRATTIISDSAYNTMVSKYNTWQGQADTGLDGTDENGNSITFPVQPAPNRPMPIIHRP